MDDRLARVEQRLAQTQGQVAEFRQDVASKIDKSFVWSIITIVVGLVITWFGIWLLLTRGANLIRRFMLQA